MKNLLCYTKSIKWFCILALTIVSVACSSQSSEEQTYMEEIYKICPKADVINVEQKVESIEVEFLCGNQPMSVLFDKQGNFLYKESKFTPDRSFLTKVEKKINKNHAGWMIDEYALIETKDTSFVKLEVVKNGVEETLFFTIDGKFYKFKNFITTETWTKELLSKSSYYASLPYDFLTPKKTFELPEVLKEISGLTVVGDSVIFCEQDELGAVFQVDLQDGTIASVGRFTDVGDFEDVQVVGDFVYVLRSDGAIFSFNFENFTGLCNQKMVDIPCMNMEGLYYDSTSKRFWISCKEPSLGRRITTKKQHNLEVAEKAEMAREIYSFDSQLKQKPQLEVSILVSDIRAFVAKNYGNTIKAENISFNPSALAINPITKELYVLSASEKMIVVYEGQTLKNVMLLPPEDFFKPEGIDFLSNGDMVICCEGQKKGYMQGQVTIIERK